MNDKRRDVLKARFPTKTMEEIDAAWDRLTPEQRAEEARRFAKWAAACAEATDRLTTTTHEASAAIGRLNEAIARQVGAK